MSSLLRAAAEDGIRSARAARETKKLSYWTGVLAELDAAPRLSPAESEQEARLARIRESSANIARLDAVLAAVPSPSSAPVPERLRARIQSLEASMKLPRAPGFGVATVEGAARAYLVNGEDEAISQFIRARYGSQALWDGAVAAEAVRLAALPGHDGVKGQALKDRATELCWSRAEAELRGLANALRLTPARR